NSVVRVKGSIAGGVSGGYICISINNVLYYAHRLAWFYVYKKWPPKFIDHVNGNRLDNRISNLRLATEEQNARNIVGNRLNTSGAIGVSWDKTTGRWKSYVGYKNKTISLGYFDSKEDAAFIAALARKKLYGTYASKALNCEHELLSQFNNDEDKLAEYLKEKSKRTRKRVKKR
ncbi:HNH endonuclease, partial [Escherichia coli]